MIFFAELFMTGGQHAPFNAAMLQVLSKAYPQEELIVYAANNHWKAIKAIDPALGRLAFQARKVIPISTGNKRQWVKKLLNEAQQIHQLLRLANKQKPSLVCFAFLSPLGQWMLSNYLQFFYRRQRVLVFLHGLEVLKSGMHTKFIDRCYRSLLKKAFHRKAPNKTYVVLTPGAKDYLLQRQYLAAQELLYLPHPAIFHPIVQQAQPTDAPIIFGHLGIARLDKQSHLFFTLAAHFQQAVKAGKIRFEVIGPVLPEMKAHLNPWVSCPSDETLLTRAAYERACSAIHYAVFCYAKDTYELTSSGAILDAIAFRKPILALRNKSFEYLFNIAETAPGKLYPNFDELVIGIQELLKNHSNYAAYEQAFVELQQYHSIDKVAATLSGN